jgi:hypothetical protein
MNRDSSMLKKEVLSTTQRRSNRNFHALHVRGGHDVPAVLVTHEHANVLAVRALLR